MAPKKIAPFSAKQQDEFLSVLQSRFEQHTKRHEGISWKDVEKKLRSSPDQVNTLYQMEQSGGEPDVVDYNAKTKSFIFFDCAAESPAGRRSCCYDPKSLNDRKENKPKYSALELAETMGCTLLNEEQYRYLQTLGAFDLKTSSWILTPDPIRKLDGALFCDRRYNHVFVYHNGASSYYAARGFRSWISV